jgi:starvation-inducible DNA-binding protein
MNKLFEALDVQVANLSVLFTKLHHFHWFVEGSEFYNLHEKFEELYDEINELYDEFAERLIIIGGHPTSTLKGYLAKATLKEAQGETATQAMLKSLIADLQHLVEQMKAIIELAQEAGDEPTADLAITTQASFEKHLWMLRATAK